jgi:serine/threonine-protein kinase HipA
MTLTTRVFPRLKHDRLALKLNGRDDNLHRGDFHALATTAGLKAGNAEAAIDEMLHRMKEVIDRIMLPAALAYAGQESIATEMRDICRSRIASFD